jgi:hypothetical protein
MSMLARRLQVLIDEDRFERLAAEAERRRVSVAVVVRDAIDAMYPTTAAARQSAGARILEAEPMAVPNPNELRDELDELRGRRG